MEKQSSFKKLYHRIHLIGINWTTKAFGIVNLVVHRSSQMPTQRVIKWKLKQRIMYDTQNVSFTFCILLYPPLPEGGGGGILFYLCPSKIFFVALFSVTVDGVFGPIRFLLPVCRLCWFLYTLNIYAHFSSHFSQQLLMAEIWYLVTSFI